MSENDTERLRELVGKQEEIIEYQKQTIEELERQREMILEVGEFPSELEKLYKEENCHD
jgi:hypothetical protein